MEGTIIRGRGGLYTALDAQNREYVLRAKKKFRRQGMSPLVGDRILFTPGEISDEHGWIDEILPRKSQCMRPAVANVTLLCIVVCPQPAPDWLLVDKLMVFASRQHLRPLLIIGKDDLPGADETAAYAQSVYRDAGMEIFRASALRQTGLTELTDRLKGETCCFSGQSGVGKSSLLNALFGLTLETGDISRKIQRGKNTTRHAELFRVQDVCVIDTPGFSLFEMDEVFDPVELKDCYPEFSVYEDACRFSPCYHGSEPGCAVLQAAEDGKIHADRLERYHMLLDDCRKLWRERYD